MQLPEKLDYTLYRDIGNLGIPQLRLSLPVMDHDAVDCTPGNPTGHYCHIGENPPSDPVGKPNSQDVIWTLLGLAHGGPNVQSPDELLSASLGSATVEATGIFSIGIELGINVPVCSILATVLGAQTGAGDYVSRTEYNNAAQSVGVGCRA